MARFCVGGGEDDGNEERPNRRLPKKPRTSDSVGNTSKKASASTPTVGRTAASKDGNLRSTSAALQTPVARESQLEKQKSSFKTTCCSEFSDNEPEEAGDEEEEMEPARVNSTHNGNVKGSESVEHPEDTPAPAPLSITLTDPDVLDCPICLEPLNPPVYQCENGHISCEPCCAKVKYKCASCSWPIGYNRCRAIEKVLDSLRISCPNVHYGCNESLYYSMKLYHEKICIYAPCWCPHPDCTYIDLSNSVYSHFARHHWNSSELFLFNYDFSVSLDINQKHVFLRETVDDTLFVLNRFIEHRGSLVSVVCIAPVSSKRKFLYEVIAMDGVSYVKLKSVAETTPQWTTGQPPDGKYLLVPNSFTSLDGQLKLEVKIRRDRGLRVPQGQK